MESSELFISANLDQTAPVSATPSVQGRMLAGGGGEGKPPRRRPPEKPSVKHPAEDADKPPHRIDSLA
jgi:hypothetical protein